MWRGPLDPEQISREAFEFSSTSLADLLLLDIDFPAWMAIESLRGFLRASRIDSLASGWSASLADPPSRMA
jgi:hypothetical protein